MSINIQILNQLRIFEDSCLAASSGGLALLSQGGSAPSASPPQKDFGTFNYLDLANDVGIKTIIENNFKATFNIDSVGGLLNDIEDIKKEILQLSKDNNNIHQGRPVFPIKYDKTKDNPMYIIGNSEMTPEQFKVSSLYSEVHILPFPDNIRDGLNYPEFNSVIKMLGTELIPKSSIIIQNVLGNGECLFRSLINGYYYSESESGSKTNDNLGFNPDNSNNLVLKMKNIFLGVLEICLSDKKTQQIFNCSDRFYQTFIELIQQELLLAPGSNLNLNDFKQKYVEPSFYGGPFECNLFSQLFNYRVNLFSRERENNKFTFNETFDNRVNKSIDNYGQTINVINVGGHFMVILW